MISVVAGDPHAPAARALLEQSHALMQALFPPQDNFFLPVAALAAPGIRFFVATEGAETLGTGALALKPAPKEDYGEVKSMFTAQAARGRGVADAILTRIVDEARAAGLPWLRLETGNSLLAAQRLYARHGFARCGRFGDYPDAASSIFMEKPL